MVERVTNEIKKDNSSKLIQLREFLTYPLNLTYAWMTNPPFSEIII